MVCGETEVAAANLRITLKNLKKKGGDGLTGFQRQMQVHVRLCNYTVVKQFFLFCFLFLKK